MKDDFFEYEDQLENEDDVPTPNGYSGHEAVVSSSDWTTETIINQINKDRIILDPQFQRRDAWRGPRKSKFIESLFLGLPVPQIVLAESKEQKGKYLVIDGKQRLLSIRQFAAQPGDSKFKQLKLSSLDILKTLNGKTLNDVYSDFTLSDELSNFENQTIRTVVIKNWPNDDFLYHVFLRLNTGSVPLSPQELRQALHPGSFTFYLDDFSSKSEELQKILGKKEPDFRMRDAEILLRFVSFNMFPREYNGNLKIFLDRTCMTLNSRWIEEQHKIIEKFNTFEEINRFAFNEFGNLPYRKWVGDKFEQRFNRAIFDVITQYLSNPEALRLAKDRNGVIRTTFIDLCENSKDFIRSVESTTKSMTATRTRFEEWYTAANRALGINVRCPIS